MADRESILGRILSGGIVAVVRSETPDPLVKAARALVEGGVDSIEITFTVPDATDVIRRVKKELGDSAVVGAGTVLDPETARLAILAGADFVVSPALNLDVIGLCRRHGKVVMPGGFTPTEILSAWEHGADVVKVFPSDAVGPSYLKAILGPLPHVRLMPTGGVDLSTAEAFLRAGACCLGAGSSLVEPKSLASGDFARIRDLARQFREIVAKVRGG
jgi:2-dehydro-3-deoxyphosphogluconate aldolase/(4S)-4-hydroxy-2-oxoglutarate aldolase